MRANSRALKKALGFSVAHFMVGLAVAFALTGQVAVALSVALVEPAVNAVILFFHARWEERSQGARGFDTFSHA
ncbi:MAG: DUF2061 domain-containing protein [Parvibaculum sp.]